MTPRPWCIPFALLGFACRLGAVYAPMPELERDKALTLYATLASYYDSNIFGSPVEERSSWVFQVAPEMAYNWKPNKQTLVAVGYRLEWDHFLDRPENQNLDSHRARARVAHTFNPKLETDVSATYAVIRNPESLLAGVSDVLSRDQSHDSLTSDGRVSWTLSQRSALAFKARLADFRYEERALSDELDRSEVLTGISWSYLAMPRLQTTAEYRAQWILYSVNGYEKDKRSHLLLGGFDYALGRTFGMTFRAGGESRRRSDGTVVRPYGEIGAKWDYRTDSFVSVGYAHTIEEVANLARYHDATINRFFANVQHALSSRLTAAGSVNWEPTELNAREAQFADADETNLRVGLALEYKITPRWDLFLTCDYDRISSDDAGRNLKRVRSGASMRVAF